MLEMWEELAAVIDNHSLSLYIYIYKHIYGATSTRRVNHSASWKNNQHEKLLISVIPTDLAFGCYVINR